MTQIAQHNRMKIKPLPAVKCLLVLSWSLFFGFMFTGPASASGVGIAGTPINFGAVLDTVFMTPVDDTKESEFEVRAFELNIGAPVDPYFDLLVTLGWHEGEFELEEAWISAILPYNIKVQAGRELLPFGYLNRVHEHDFPQVDQPYVIEGLLTDHGLIGDGGHIEFLAPFLNPTLSLNVGIYDSIQHSVGRRIDGFPWVGRIQSFYQSPSGSHSLLTGASYLNSVSDKDPMEGRSMSDPRARGKVNYMAGIDIKYKWTPEGRTYRGLTLGGEYLYIDYDPYKEHDVYVPGLNVGHDKGFFAYAAWDFDRFWGIGYRYDNTDVLFSRLEDNAGIEAHSVYGEWRATEFSRLRLQYQYVDDELAGEKDNLVMVQGTFFIGWHPPHLF